MVLHHNQSYINSQPGTPAVQVYANTLGVRLANGNVTPCTVQGQRAEFVFGKTVSGIDTVANGFGVPLRSKAHSGGMAVQVLAGGAITAGHDLVVGIVSFAVPNTLINGGTGTTNVNLPCVIDVDDADEGDWIIGKATYGTSAAAKDDFDDPTICIEFRDVPMQVKGAGVAPHQITFHFALADIDNGDLVTDYPIDFNGAIESFRAVVTDPATTAAKLSNLHLEIGAVAVTGGVLALTSANMTPQGNVVEASAITALNVVTPASVISIVAADTTAFVEGEVDLIITFEVAAP